MTAILVCGGTLSAAFLQEIRKQYKEASIYAVDGGLTIAATAGIVPDVLVGDFDTAEPVLVEQYAKQCKVFRHPPEKDATDTELAIELAIEHGAEELVLLGATGSRMDHTLANIHMLYKILLLGKRACIRNENNRISLHKQSFYKKKEEMFGNFVSFLPFGGEVTGVTLRGFKYPLEHALLTAGNSLGISNEVLSENIEISFETGYLLMIESRD